MDDGGGFIGKLLVVVALTILNGLFAAAEISLISSNRGKIQGLAEEGSPRAKKLLQITGDQRRFISTIQVGITLAGFFAAGITAQSLAYSLGQAWLKKGWTFGPALAFFLVLLALAFFTLLFGELIPKRIALRNPAGVALRLAPIISVFYVFFKPFVSCLSGLTTLILKVTGSYSEGVEQQISEEELKSYIRVGQEQGVINLSGEEMMVSIMDFDDKTAEEIMTPRTDLYMIDYDEFTEETIGEMLQTGFSRAPVYQEDTDNIIGTVYIKDIFINYAKNNYQKIDIDKILKEPYFVPEGKNIDLLLKELQSTKNYIAILIDEYGGCSGMVTIEDIVEEIVGEIEDEYDSVDQGVEQINPNTYIIEGSMDLDDINDLLFTDFESENHETLSGLTIELLGFIPEEEDKRTHQVFYKNEAIFTALGVKDKRIDKVQVELLEGKKESKEED